MVAIYGRWSLCAYTPDGGDDPDGGWTLVAIYGRWSLCAYTPDSGDDPDGGDNPDGGDVGSVD